MLDSGSRVAVCGGVALYLISANAIQLSTPSSLRRSVLVLVARLLVVRLALALIGAGLGPLALVGLLARWRPSG